MEPKLQGVVDAMVAKYGITANAAQAAIARIAACTWGVYKQVYEPEQGPTQFWNKLYEMMG